MIPATGKIFSWQNINMIACVIGSKSWIGSAVLLVSLGYGVAFTTSSGGKSFASRLQASLDPVLVIGGTSG